VTTPATLVAPVVKVKVVVLIVAGFMALLKDALMTTAVPQVRVEPERGFTDVTWGGVRGLPGFPAPGFASESPQPAMAMASKRTGIQILLTFNLRISFSS
jgi:hypothetical protein